MTSKYLAQIELVDPRGIRLYLPIWMAAANAEDADAAAKAFEDAFVNRGYKVLRRTDASVAEGSGDYLRGEVSAYVKDRPQKPLAWSLVRFNTQTTASEGTDPLREVIKSVASPLSAVILSGDKGTELLSVVVTVGAAEL
jgi:hypothetical protein